MRRIGWQAIWKINRATCEKLKINYPIVVFGMVNNVFFQDLKADFSVIAVQDDDIHLPERYEVPLEDLFPTIEQENDELNIDRTADCLDELRYENAFGRNQILTGKIILKLTLSVLFELAGLDFSTKTFGCHGTMTPMTMKLLIGATSIWRLEFVFALI